MAIIEGPLSKWTNIVKGWQYRWFVLDESNGTLVYYTSKEKMTKGSRRGCIPLRGAVTGIDDEDESTFTITVDNHIYHFQARDVEDREKWIEALELTILKMNNPMPQEKQKPSLSVFEQKLAESDAYLQALIDQVKEIDRKIDKSNDNQVKERLTLVKDTAQSVIESVKQAIVLLQIAKANTLMAHIAQEAIQLNDPGNDSTPRTGKTVKTIDDTSDSEGPGPSFSLLPRPDGLKPGNLSLNEDLSDMSSQSSDAGWLSGELDPDSDSLDRKAQKSPNKTGKASTVSDDSDDDDDAFYDANEDPKPSVKIESKDRSSEALSTNATPTTTSAIHDAPVIASQDDVYDELYDDPMEDDLETSGDQGSVIAHLVSQVRIGMDLTKIVLPTFILERRSLLEMFADFLAHPDIFVSITDQKTPQDRMVQCVKWYLSAFHAGRRSDVAKKPYNPILGETFQCYYDVPGIPPSSKPHKDTVQDGPVPWATKNNVTVICEQVSHHPPISAFYAEHYNKNISLDGYMWTKSKFLGLSVGVHMIGQGVVSVLQHDEEYVITFPNAYGRSILTRPWMELGGKVHINCAKTGYSGTIEFHTKPFYGGKKNEVTAEINAPGEKKPFCHIKGEWNGVMWAKYASGMNEKFVDTMTTPICKKLVRPLDKQDHFESRRLWKEVTASLKLKNMTKATEHKAALESAQRESAKQRATDGHNWKCKHFSEVGEHWVYLRPLQSRKASCSSTSTAS